jgi:hypothetical protein
MTTTDATAADLALAELHEHIARIEQLSHEPFNAGRIAIHRAEALECLDLIAGVLA